MTQTQPIPFTNRPKRLGWVPYVLTAGCVYFLVSTLIKDSTILRWQSVPDSLAWVLVIVFLAMIANWYLEVVRWKLSMDHVQPISTREAWAAVLGGLALNWILPFTSGDLLARVASHKDKYQATAATFVNRYIMLAITACIGGYGVSRMAGQISVYWELIGAIAIVSILVGVIFHKAIRRSFQYFRLLSAQVFLRICLLSVLRYGVFVFQFYILLVLFLPDLPAEVILAGIGWIFLIRTILPLVMGGVGVREASGIFFFQSWIPDASIVLLPIFLIWVINHVIPSAVGLIFIWKLQWKTNG